VDLFLTPHQPLHLQRPGSGARRISECELRGYCGPFANEALYDAFPEAMWHGMGDCMECGTTCHVSRELQRRERTAATSGAGAPARRLSRASSPP
jgi:hypothetical protein